ncbi:MAG: tetratricopeptide repeat protein, partial [Flavobacteriales bacterium]
MKSVTTFLFALICIALSAQEGAVPPSGNVSLAKSYMSLGSYSQALDELLLAIKKDPEDLKLHALIAECYLNTNEDKTKAIAHLEKVLKGGKYDAIVLFDLGKAYAYNEELDKALEYFNRYKKEGKLKPEDIDEVDHEIECAQTAKELMKIPINVSFSNLGKDVNTEYFEGHPFATENESAIYFTTKRKGTTGGEKGDDGFTSDVYSIDLKNNDKWSKAKNVGATINTFSLEEITSLSSNGSYLVFTMIDDFYIQRIKYCEKVGKARAFGKAIDFGDLINDSKSAQTAGCISNDGQTCIFSSNREGGYGGFDLYISVKRPNGTWGEPLNLGSKINTKYDETYPNFGVEENVLYFASAGHTNMGGLDIFKTTFSLESHAFGNPVNLGYPINTTDNDYSISYNKSGRNAYIGRRKTGGFGNLDIYQLTFKNT